MPSVDLTHAKLADIKKKAKAALNSNWISKRSPGWIQDEYDLVSFGDCFPDEFENDDQHKVYSDVCEVLNYIVEADPATVLAMVEEIERLRLLQCWVIMRKDNRDQVFDGPFFTEEDARLHVPDSLDYEYTVEPWVNQANVIESEAGQ